MQLVFDEFSEQLKTSLEDVTWGGIDETLKADLVKSVESHLHIYKHCIASTKESYSEKTEGISESFFIT